ncbi:Zinc finger CCCH domain-containing protein 58 [Vitis vinifera]|uniref:Zinc finger CCCH domain-containing protein 58 n=1 Tax=Vitis vinifera TaxID=29760 RepID=A0A438F6U1_VITVI|nr:Zinc finger CCCH domain-containing protein 58 [Vitis vinifera]
MDRYGRAPAMEGSPSDPSQEWTGPVAETGLEGEAFVALGIGGGGEAYPERPDEADCIYYLKTGFCGYGARCRFNHPRDRGGVGGTVRPGGGEFPERVGQPVCQFYMKTGTCKFGASCKYHHPRQGGGTVSPVTLNYFGYPLRPGEKECSYYVKTGLCKFGETCKFHHPQPDSIQLSTPGPAALPAPVPAHTLYPMVQSPSVPSSQQYGLVVARPPLLPSSYIHGPYSPVLIPQEWFLFRVGVITRYAPVSPVASPSTQPTVGSGQMYGLTPLSPSAPAYTGPYTPLPSSVGPSSSSQKEQIFPERPGQPECQYYMRTGDCKFGSSCKYHHPPEWDTPKTNCVLSPMGLPLRPAYVSAVAVVEIFHCHIGLCATSEHSLPSLTPNCILSAPPTLPEQLAEEQFK